MKPAHAYDEEPVEIISCIDCGSFHPFGTCPDCGRKHGMLIWRKDHPANNPDHPANKGADNDPPNLTDLGWANSWPESEPVPDVIIHCRELGHTPADVVRAGERHHVVTCLICRYIYSYDSSD